MSERLGLLAAIHAVMVGSLLVVFAWDRDGHMMLLLGLVMAVHWYGIWIGVDVARKTAAKGSRS